MKTMRFLIITLCNLTLFSLTAQNTGINIATPERTLHVNGEVQIDSATYMHQLFLQNDQDSSRIIFNPDSGSMEFWDNDTLWYRLKVGSPPEELRSNGNYTVEKRFRYDEQSIPIIETTYSDEDGNVVLIQKNRVDPNLGDTKHRNVTEIYENNCLKERFSDNAGGGESIKITFDCPSGDTCFVETTRSNNSSQDRSWDFIRETRNVKLGMETTHVERSEDDPGGNHANKFSLSMSSSGSPLGGRGYCFNNNAATFNLFGKNEQGFVIKVEDLLAGPDPNLFLNIKEDDKKASFCNTKEIEQKIDSTLKKRGIIDNSLKIFKSRIETPLHFYEGLWSPNAGSYIQSSSLSSVIYSQLFLPTTHDIRFTDGANTSSCTISPSTQSRTFSESASSGMYTLKWTPSTSFVSREVKDAGTGRGVTCRIDPVAGARLYFYSGSTVQRSMNWSLVNPTVIVEDEDTGTGNKMSCTSNPVLGLRSFDFSQSTIQMRQAWEMTNATYTQSMFNSSDNREIRFIHSPSVGQVTFSANGNVEQDRQIDNANNLYITRCVDVISGAKINRIQNPNNGAESVDVDGDMQADEEFDEPNGQVISSVVNKSLNADISFIQKPDILPQQSQLLIQSSQNNLDMFVAGNAHFNGLLSKLAGAFKIDHPLDPYNKYLVHSFVESPDMMNIYNGNVVTDENGMAIVKLPDYFEAANMEPRYQLTVIGTFDQAIIFEEVKNNQFAIKSSAPNVKVSWQVTGIRNDKFARENRIDNEVQKGANKKGSLLYTGKMDIQ